MEIQHFDINKRRNKNDAMMTSLAKRCWNNK